MKRRVIIYFCLLTLLSGCTSQKQSDVKSILDSKNYGKIIDFYSGGNIDINADPNFSPVEYVWRSTGNLEEMELLLKLGADVNYTDKHDNSLLMLAVGADRQHYIYGPQYIKLFIKYGADVNLANKKGLTPIDLAVESRNLKAYNLLAENNANVSVKTLGYIASEDYDTSSYIQYELIHKIVMSLPSSDSQVFFEPILDAAIRGDSDTVIRLWKERADHIIEPPLLFNSIAFCSPETVCAMIGDHDIEEYRDLLGHDALYVAAKNENIPMVHYLLDYCNYDNLSLSNMLSIVLPTGNKQLLILLYNYGARLDWDYYKSEEAWELFDIPILDLVPMASIEVIELVLDWGYPLDEVTAHLAMKKAILNNRIDVLDFFLSKGFNIDYFEDGDYGSSTLLYEACHVGKIDIVEHLLRHGADVNANTNSTLEPKVIFVAAQKNDLELFDLLVNYGADVDVKNLEGKTLLQVANDVDAHLIVEKLSQEND